MVIDEREFAREFAINLRRLMYEKQIEQKDIANALGVSRSIVSAWMNAKRTPRMDKIDALCSYFGCSRSDIMEPHTRKRQAKEVTDEQAELIQLAPQAILTLQGLNISEIYEMLTKEEKRRFWRGIIKEIRFDKERNFFYIWR